MCCSGCTSVTGAKRWIRPTASSRSTVVTPHSCSHTAWTLSATSLPPTPHWHIKHKPCQSCGAQGSHAMTRRSYKHFNHAHDFILSDSFQWNTNPASQELVYCLTVAAQLLLQRRPKRTHEIQCWYVTISRTKTLSTQIDQVKYKGITLAKFNLKCNISCNILHKTKV